MTAGNTKAEDGLLQEKELCNVVLQYSDTLLLLTRTLRKKERKIKKKEMNYIRLVQHSEIIVL